MSFWMFILRSYRWAVPWTLECWLRHGGECLLPVLLAVRSGSVTWQCQFPTHRHAWVILFTIFKGLECRCVTVDQTYRILTSENDNSVLSVAGRSHAVCCMWESTFPVFRQRSPSNGHWCEACWQWQQGSPPNLRQERLVAGNLAQVTSPWQRRYRQVYRYCCFWGVIVAIDVVNGDNVDIGEGESDSQRLPATRWCDQWWCIAHVKRWGSHMYWWCFIYRYNHVSISCRM